MVGRSPEMVIIPPHCVSCGDSWSEPATKNPTAAEPAISLQPV
jgi:hypothetical protein